MKSIFMINEIIDEFQWLGIPEMDEEIGVRLAKVQFSPVRDMFNPIRVEWLPETMNRKICDFPNFRSQFTCMSDRAIYHLNPLIYNEGEYLDLYGVEVEYKAFHCLTIYDALDHEFIAEMKRKDDFLSIASPSVALPLLLDRVGDSHIFHVPEVRNKFFVSEHFKEIYERNLLSGLSFHKVPIR